MAVILQRGWGEQNTAFPPENGLRWRPAAGYAAPDFGRFARLLPIGFVVSYLTISILLFAFGPWLYPPISSAKLYGFVTLAHVALLAGYLSAGFGRPGVYVSRMRPERLLFWSVVVSLAFVLPTAAYRTGEILPSITASILNPGTAYVRSYQLRNEAPGFVEYLRILAGPILALLIPLTAGYWNLASRTLKIAASAAVAGGILTYLAMGTNKGLADPIMVIGAVLAARVLGRQLRLSRAQLLAAVAALALACGLFLTFFSIASETRSGSHAKYGLIPKARARADYTNPLLTMLPESATVGALGVTSYMSSGYYGLALALDQPFVSMYGVGHSRFLYRQASRLLDDGSLMLMSYPDRVQGAVGWDATGLWATIYPWIASDVGFPGTLLAVFLIGRLFAQCWIDAMKGQNPFAYGMLGQFAIMLIYFPGNNQCLQDGEGVASFWVLLLCWRLTRR